MDLTKQEKFFLKRNSNKLRSIMEKRIQKIKDELPYKEDDEMKLYAEMVKEYEHIWMPAIKNDSGGQER